MIVVMLITAVETTGDVFATGEIVEKRIGKDDIARALRADGLATTLGGVLNSFPYTCFAENVGLVRLTRVKSRYVVAAAGVIMIILGLLPKAAAIVAGIPHPVLGGAALAMFATVAVVGIQTLTRVDFHDHRNVVIVATSIGLAMYVTAQPDVAKAVPDWAQIIFGSGITLGSLTAILLNLVFFHIGKSRGPAVAGTPGCRRPPGPGQRDVARRVRRDLLAACSRARSWVVERAYDQRPFTDTQDLRRAFQEALFAASTEEQEQLIGSYPNLGAQPSPPGTRARSRWPTSPARAEPAGREGARGAGDAGPGLPRPVRLPAGRWPFATRSRSTRSCASGWERLNNSPDPGARRRADRDREDRDAPVRPAGGRREPDPLGPLPHLDA